MLGKHPVHWATPPALLSSDFNHHQLCWDGHVRNMAYTCASCAISRGISPLSENAPSDRHFCHSHCLAIDTDVSAASGLRCRPRHAVGRQLPELFGRNTKATATVGPRSFTCQRVPPSRVFLTHCNTNMSRPLVTYTPAWTMGGLQP